MKFDCAIRESTCISWKNSPRHSVPLALFDARAKIHVKEIYV